MIDTATAPAWTDGDVKVSRALSDALVQISNMVLARPDTAPLLAGMFRNLINPVNGADDPGAAMRTLCDAAAASGGTVSDATGGGKNLDFGPLVMEDRFGPLEDGKRPVRVWVVEFALPPAPVAAASPPGNEPAASAASAQPPGSPDDTVLLTVPAEVPVPLPDLGRTQAMDILPADDLPAAVTEAGPVAEQVSA